MPRIVAAEATETADMAAIVVTVIAAAGMVAVIEAAPSASLLPSA
jgi:hypothetical protein